MEVFHNSQNNNNNKKKNKDARDVEHAKANRIKI